MKTVIFFNLPIAAVRRLRIDKVTIDQVEQRAWRAIVRDDEHARKAISAAWKAAKIPIKFLIMDDEAYIQGLGQAANGSAFGGPFRKP